MATASIEIIADSSQVRTATQDLKNLAAQGKTVQAITDGANKAVGSFGRTAGQAGIQVQQLVGQIQGGVSPFVAISQQAADLGYVLGVPLLGAVVSIAAAFAGPFLQAIIESTDKTEDFKDAIKRLQDTQKEFSAAAYAAEFGRLNTEYDKLQRQIDANNKQIAQFTKLSQQGGSAGAAYASEITRLAIANKFLQGDQKELSQQMGELYDSSIANLAATGDLSAEQEKMADSTSRLNEQLKIQNITLTQGELQARLYAAALQTAGGDISKLDAETRRLIETNYALEQADKQIAKNKVTLLNEQKRAAKEAADELKAIVDEELSELERRQTAINSFVNLQGALSPAEQARQQYQARLDVIREYEAQEGADLAQANAAKIAAHEAYQKQLTAIDTQESQARQALTQSQLTAAGDLLGTLSQLAYQGGEKSFMMYKRLAQAQALVAGSLAIIRALAEGGPYLGPALAVATGALVGAQIAMIEKQQYQPRALGGQVMGSSSYLVGERGPELFTPNSSGGGRITPFNQLMSEARSGSQQNAPVINIANYGGQAEVTQSRWSEADRRFIIDIVTGDIANRGRTHSAITRNTTAGNRTA